MNPVHDFPADPGRIEDALSRDRATLADSLQALKSRLTVSALTDEAAALLQHNAAPLTRSLDRAVRANPLAVACIGVGLAWLAFGRRAPAPSTGDCLAGTRFEAITRWEDEGGPPAPADELPPDPEADWLDRTDRLRDGALATLAQIQSAAQGGLASAAQTAADRAAVVAGFARDARDALRGGLHTLPAAAQDRIAALRERAYLAHREARSGTGRLIEQEPLLAGGVALAIGAGLAAALPRTATEDRLFGAERTRLVAAAQDLLVQERRRAAGLMADLADTLRDQTHMTAAALASGTPPTPA